MITNFKNMFNIPDLRKRLFFTFMLLAVYRIGAHIPVPGLDLHALEDFFKQLQGGIFGFLDIFAGGALRRFTIFALGIMPYISASIILQLLTVVWPYLERLSKEGEAGRKKITQYTRYGTGLICILQAAGISLWIEQARASGGAPVVQYPGWRFRLMTVLTLTTGTIFIMWLGEQISERGIGNGISLIIFAGIVVQLPGAIIQTLSQLKEGTMSLITLLVLVVLMLGVCAFIVFFERAQRRIPVQYAKRVVGRRMYAGQSTHLPLKVNTGGVIPIIFASSIILFPQTISQLPRIGEIGWMKAINAQLQYGMPLYILIYVVAIIFFCYFYTSIIFNPVDTADNIKKFGGFIPGIRPGKATATYIDNVLSRITLGGALYLSAVAVLPMILMSGLKIDQMGVWGERIAEYLPAFIVNGLGVPFYFGGTSLLIVIGVAMDTVAQVESQLIMRHYDGFLKGPRMRGRR